MGIALLSMLGYSSGQQILKKWRRSFNLFNLEMKSFETIGHIVTEPAQIPAKILATSHCLSILKSIERVPEYEANMSQI